MDPAPPDARRYAPATERNRGPILQVLQRILPATGIVLEVASGTGEHGVFFASHFPDLRWQPTDPDPLSCDSIEAWRQATGVPSVQDPLPLNAQDPEWPVEGQPWSGSITAIVNINMIHIAPWSACEGLMAGAERILVSSGILYLYGPFKRQGQHTAPSNAEFDAMLRRQDPEWGVRDLDTVIELAAAHHLQWVETVAMPANNLSVIFQRM